MKRVRLFPVALVVVYFLLAFNAYACLLPLYGDVQTAKGSDCATPKEPPVRDACDAYRAIGVQSLSSAQPLPDCHSQAVMGEPVAVPMLDSVQPARYEFSGSPPFLVRDPLALTSILRI